MENHEPNPIIVLKVNISCCSDCPKKLRKALSTINGIQSVGVDQEKNLVFVSGNNVDPKLLIRTIERMGKKVDLSTAPTDDHSSNNSHQYDATAEDKCPQEGLFFREQKAAEKSRKCYCQGNNNNNNKKEEDDHKIENFEEPPRSHEFDSEICGDPYCRIHMRSQIMHEGVPLFLGGNRLPLLYNNWHQQPFLGGYFRPPGRWQPPPYDYPMSMPPPAAYGGGGFHPMEASFGNI